jgi:hypothetical protein
MKQVPSSEVDSYSAGQGVAPFVILSCQTADCRVHKAHNCALS